MQGGYSHYRSYYTRLNTYSDTVTVQNALYMLPGSRANIVAVPGEVATTTPLFTSAMDGLELCHTTLLDNSGGSTTSVNVCESSIFSSSVFASILIFAGCSASILFIIWLTFEFDQPNCFAILL